MEQILRENGFPLDINKLEFLSNKGSEFVVYKYFDTVIKIYKKNYLLSHQTLEELNTLKKIITQRILLPTGTLWNRQHELIGYEMPFIDGEKSLEDDSVHNFFKELEILKQDLDILCSNSIILRDINPSNTIYNGHIYLIDPGNYLVNELNKVIFHLNTDSLTLEESQKLLTEWNHNKINKLVDMMLFYKKDNIDFFQFRQINQFFQKVKKEKNFIYILDALKIFFDEDINVRNAVNTFMKQYIKDDPKEKALLLSLYNNSIK